MKNLNEIENILKNYKPELIQKYNVSELGIFGSFARNEQSEASDIDILIDFKQPIGLQFVEIADNLEKVLGLKVDLVSKNAIKPRLMQFIQQDIRYV